MAGGVGDMEPMQVPCLAALWLTNLLGSDDPDTLQRELLELFDALDSSSGHCVLVTNEVGLGIMPMNALARRFADEAGTLHRRLAVLCDRVIFMVAGLPMMLKPQSPGAA